jgi:hypothetical protein
MMERIKRFAADSPFTEDPAGPLQYDHNRLWHRHRYHPTWMLKSVKPKWRKYLLEQYGIKMKALVKMDQLFIANTRSGMPLKQAKLIRDQQYSEIYAQFHQACEPIDHYEKLRPWG